MLALFSSSRTLLLRAINLCEHHALLKADIWSIKRWHTSFETKEVSREGVLLRQDGRFTEAAAPFGIGRTRPEHFIVSYPFGSGMLRNS